MVDDNEAPIIVNDPGERKFFIMIPFLIDDMGLSKNAVRLYLHLKRRAGENNLCFENGRNLARWCKMSTGTVSAAKKELEEAGLITVTSRLKKTRVF